MLRAFFIVLGLSLAASLCAADAGQSIEKFTISRNDAEYECFPALTRLKSGRVILTYRESDSHPGKEYTRIIIRTSDDDGKTWSDRRALAESKKIDGVLLKYNCPKVQQLKDGRALIVCDREPKLVDKGAKTDQTAFLQFWFSDNGQTWSEPQTMPVGGIMPDEVIELDNGDWLIASQWRSKETGYPTVWATRSRDQGKTWEKPVVIVGSKIYKFCEASILKLPGGKLVCYLRENRSLGLPIYKCVSYDNGQTWQGPFETPMNAGHRPVAHLTQSGKVLITYRFQPAGLRPWAKNTFAYLELPSSALELDVAKQHGIVLPIDHDRNSHSDGGYTGWVETAPGEFLMVNYIKDDAPMAQIRGYRFTEKDF